MNTYMLLAAAAARVEPAVAVAFQTRHADVLDANTGGDAIDTICESNSHSKESE